MNNEGKKGNCSWTHLGLVRSLELQKRRIYCKAFLCLGLEASKGIPFGWKQLLWGKNNGLQVTVVAPTSNASFDKASN